MSYQSTTIKRQQMIEQSEQKNCKSSNCEFSGFKPSSSVPTHKNKKKVPRDKRSLHRRRDSSPSDGPAKKIQKEPTKPTEDARLSRTKKKHDGNKCDKKPKKSFKLREQKSDNPAEDQQHTAANNNKAEIKRQKLSENPKKSLNVLDGDVQGHAFSFLDFRDITNLSCTRKGYDEEKLTNPVFLAFRNMQSLVFCESAPRDQKLAQLGLLRREKEKLEAFRKHGTPYLAGLGHSIKEIRVDGFRQCPLDDAELNEIVGFVSDDVLGGLEKLLVQGSTAQFSIEQMFTILTTCPGFESLRHPESFKILQQLVENKKKVNLKELNIVIHDFKRDDDLNSIADITPEATSITIRDDTDDSNNEDDFRYLARGIARAMLVWKKVEHVCFPGVYFKDSLDILRGRGAKFPHIKKLSLPGANLNDNDLSQIVEMFPNVTDASFPGNSITDAAVEIMESKWGKNLSTLSLDGTEVTEETVKILKDDKKFGKLDFVYLQDKLKPAAGTKPIIKGNKELKIYWCVSW